MEGMKARTLLEWMEFKDDVEIRINVTDAFNKLKEDTLSDEYYITLSVDNKKEIIIELRGKE
ncbi:hypothetical protein V5T82_14085 [Magnetovibrio sp. PR-2]|uniref:hypothetical protein n=1 Tax=Magnetovibrio sp. PR-2 TaxID=3120356 RepID=UPI002FCE2939